MTNKPEQLSLPDRVRHIQLRTFLSNSSGNAAALMTGGVLLALVLYDSGVARNQLLAWISLLFVLCLAIGLLGVAVRRIGLTYENTRRFFRARVLLGGIACSLYGATVGLLPDQMGGTSHAFAFLIASTLVAVCYMAYATVFRFCLAINLLTLMPFTLLYFYRFFTLNDRFFLLMGITAVLWQVIVSAKALLVSRSVVGSIVATERLADEMAERGRAAEALRSSEEKSQQLASLLRLTCDNVPDMIWAKDLENRYIFVNKTLCDRLLNVENTEDPLGKTFDYFAQRERERYPDNPDWYSFGKFAQDIDRHTLSREVPTIFEESGTVFGQFVYLDVHQARFINAQGEVIGTVGCARDITERKASEERVHYLAHHDVLTDLPNRALLNDRLNQALAQAQRDLGKLAVLFIDLDNLKPVNDCFGHDAGDLLLKEVAGRLREVVTRQTDTVARLGGDEFVILLQRINKEQDAAAIAGKVLQALSRAFAIDEKIIHISASIGIALFPGHGKSASQLLKQADDAMYQAKLGGRNGYCYFDPAIHAGAREPEPEAKR